MENSYIKKRKETVRIRQEALRGPRRFTVHFLEGAASDRGASVRRIEANGVASLLSGIDIDLWPEDRFCGTFDYYEPAGFVFGLGWWAGDDLLEEYIAQEGIAGPEAERLRDAIAWLCGRVGLPEDEHYRGMTENERLSVDAVAGTSIWYGGHAVLDFEEILKKGLGGYEKDIDECPDRDLAEACRTVLGGIRNYIRRYAELARRCADDPEYDRERVTRIARMLERIGTEPPETFEEALQLVWILHAVDGVDSFGRFDHYMSPFYERDIAAGTLTREEAYLDLVDLWIRVEYVGAIQNMTIGGTAPDGKAFYTGLTKLILETVADVGLKGPNLCLLVRKDMPDEIWDAALACIGRGIGIPALYCDEDYIDMLLREGYDPITARGYCLAGCSQVMIPGMSNFVNDAGLYNIAKVMELTLYGGKDPLTGEQVGPETPDLTETGSFEELYANFLKQNDYFISLTAKINNKLARYLGSECGYVLRSLFTKDCLEKGKGFFEGGPRYNNIELEIIGMTNAADSLLAVKKAVFEEKRFSGEEMLRMLRADFTGREKEREYLRSAIAKFGNDDREADALRADISRYVYGRFSSEPSVIGGHFVPGEVMFNMHDYCGSAVGATPDGRLSGKALADSAGASQGLDRNGPTALMNSVCGIGARGYFLTTAVLNLRFMPEVWKEAVSNGKIRSLFETFFGMGGTQLQINVCDPDVLRAAQKDPDSYRSLVVRVGGYSEYFTNLTPSVQNELIERTSQTV